MSASAVADPLARVGEVVEFNCAFPRKTDGRECDRYEGSPSYRGGFKTMENRIKHQEIYHEGQ